MRWIFSCLLFISVSISFAQKPVFVSIETNYGNILVKLSDLAPKHRDNFVKLVKQHYFDTTLIHRVVPGFVIQGGEPDSLFTTPTDTNILKKERLMPEFHPDLFHKRGAFGMGRDDNPLYASFFTQFYITTGHVYTDAQLDSIETKRMQGRKISAARREVYKTIGGVPWLDDRYMIFGEVVKAMEVVDKISLVKAHKELPEVPVTIKMRIVTDKEVPGKDR